ncbi:hypothetical protein [Cellulosimicrobium sp. I38E]|uniref:hypothetical protein n=1 Tax=Cellulosimicrobium sp. I38E TaxID=1393139 RepID=UPI0007B27815|nr:hypothetical protein [Cellulosimicrobium sp. I38E]KZM78395.1 hypothetical protein A0J59_13780 [Cellulosimicrobium sp. I38E]
MARIRAKNGNVLEVEDEVHVKSLLRRGHELLDGDPADGEGKTGEPVAPKSNSSKADWAAWAEHLGIEVPGDAKKADIQDLVANFKPNPEPVPPTGDDGNPTGTEGNPPAGDTGEND